MKKQLLSVGFMVWVASPGWAAQGTVFLEDMTSAEVRTALKEGKTTIIIPVGGTEQTGPHMVLGKHNKRVMALSAKVAQALENTLVAPVVAYVPEGQVTPATGHMRFAGTISVPDGAFKSIIEGAARSLRQHGFVNIVLVGDHGGYQPALKAVATSLNREWAKTPARVHFIADYYGATQTTYVRALRSKGLSDTQIGLHGGTADAALSMALDPASVRSDQFATAAHEGPAGGTVGDPRAATAALGQLGADAVVLETIAAIRREVNAAR